MRHSSIAALLAAASTVAVAGVAKAELAYGITGTVGGLQLFSFDTASPGSPTIIGNLTGVLANQSIKAIDFRPSDGRLYALSTGINNGQPNSALSAAQLYTINLSTAAATPIGSGITLTGNTSGRVSMDFNPVVDRLRVVTGNNQNYRVNPSTGALVAQDTTLAYSSGDVRFGSVPLISGVAYTNNFAGATSTTMYVIDYNLDNLAHVGSIGGSPLSPNSGQMFSVGQSTQVTDTASAGFDISRSTGIAYLQTDIFEPTAAPDTLFSMDLGTGLITSIGTFGPLTNVLDISITIPEPTTLAAVGVLGLIALRRR
jgi:hypothetical protein